MKVLDRRDQEAIASYLAANLQRPVSLELWTRRDSPLVRSDRDPCTHCDDTLELARIVASLHSGLSLTLYDLDKHTERADKAGIDRPPVTVIRGGGRTLRFTGFWAGSLLSGFLDAVVYVASATTPLQEATREALSALSSEVAVEVLVAPYDPSSAQLMRLALALGVESRQVTVAVTEIAEFPLMAVTRGVTELPVLFANDHRFVGGWEEADLVEQLCRVAGGNGSPVIRDRAPAVPFLTEEQANHAAETHGGGPATQGGGLVIPGRS